MITYADTHEILSDGMYRCKYCDKPPFKNAAAFGTHFVQWCKTKLLNNAERKEILRKAKTARKNSSDNAKAAQKAYRSSDKGRATRKKWRLSPAGRKSQKLADDRYYKTHPWKIEAFKKFFQQLFRNGHRLKKSGRKNKKFAKEFKSAKFGVRKSNVFKKFKNLEKSISLAQFNRLTQRLGVWFNEIDSKCDNYAYLLCNSLIWSEEMTFGDFLKSIFYVGRGIGGRFLAHLREAQIILNRDHELDEQKWPKEAKIMEIWQKGSVNVLIINLDKFAEKTDFVEFAITATLGLDNLTNKRFNGMENTPDGFTIKDVENTALYYLMKAFKEREDRLECFYDDDFGEQPDYGKKKAKSSFEEDICL